MAAVGRRENCFGEILPLIINFTLKQSVCHSDVSEFSVIVHFLVFLCNQRQSSMKPNRADGRFGFNKLFLLFSLHSFVPELVGCCCKPVILKRSA